MDLPERSVSTPPSVEEPKTQEKEFTNMSSSPTERLRTRPVSNLLTKSTSNVSQDDFSDIELEPSKGKNDPTAVNDGFVDRLKKTVLQDDFSDVELEPSKGENDPTAVNDGFANRFKRTTIRRSKRKELRTEKKMIAKINSNKEIKIKREGERKLVNKLGNLAFDAEMSQFLQDGILKPGSLMFTTRRKLLEYPPLRSKEINFEESIDEVLSKLPEIISSYNRATGRDWTKKLRKMTVGNLALVLVPETAEGMADTLMASSDLLALDAGKEHNYYQRELLAIFSLFLSGMEADGGIEAFSERIKAFHQLSELPTIYRKCFDGLRRIILHSLVKMGENKDDVNRMRKIYALTPRSSIIALLKLKSRKSTFSGVVNLLVQKFGGYTLIQRMLYSHMDVGKSEALKNQAIKQSTHRAATQLIIKYIDDNFPFEQEWRAFDDLNKIKVCLTDQILCGKVKADRQSSFLDSMNAKLSKRRVSPRTSVSEQDILDNTANYDTDLGVFSPVDSTNSLGGELQMSLEEIDGLGNDIGLELFNAIEKVLTYKNQTAFVEFMGTPVINKFLEKAITSLASPLGDANHAGAVPQIVSALFDLIELTIKVLSDDSLNVLTKRVTINDQLKIFMEACYTFLHTAITNDTGEFNATLRWVLCSYYSNQEPFCVDDLFSGLEPNVVGKVWAEVDALLEHQKNKTGKRDETPKPSIEAIESLLPRFTTILEKQLELISNKELEIDPDVDVVHLASNRLAGFLEDDQNAPKVVTHLEISTSEQIKSLLMRQGFLSSCDLSRGKLGEPVYILYKRSKINTHDIAPITDIAVATDDAKALKLQLAGFIKISKNIKSRSIFGNNISLWYQRGRMVNGIMADPIDDLVVVSGDKQPQGNYKSTNENLNKASLTGRHYCLWYRNLSNGPQAAHIA